MNILGLQKKISSLVLIFTLALNFFVVAQVFAQTSSCSTSASDGATCSLSGGQWVPANDAKCVCPAGSTTCDTNVADGASCSLSGGQWAIGTEAKCICPSIGGTTGGGSGGTGGTVNSGGAGNCADPSLVWDANAKICLPKNQTCTSGSIACVGSLSDLIIKVIDYLLFFAGIIGVLFVIIGGFWYITAAGNEEQSEKGKKALLNAIIGIVVVSLSYLIIRVVANTLNSGSVTGN